MMQIVLGALAGAVGAAFGTAIGYAIWKALKLSEERKPIIVFAAIVIGLGAARLAPVDNWALALRSQSSLEVEADRVFSNIPFAATLKETNPQVYEQMRFTVIASVRAGEAELVTMNRIRPITMRVISESLPHASDETLVLFADFSADQLDFLSSHNSNHCYEMAVSPERLSFNPAGVFPPEMQRREYSLLSRLLQDAAAGRRAPAVPIGDEQLAPLLEAALRDMPQSQLATLERIEFDPSRAQTDEERAASCTFLRGVMRAVATLPDQESAQHFRQLVAASRST